MGLPIKSKNVTKWHDKEQLNIYVFAIVNFPYIFHRRMQMGELCKYGIGQNDAEAVLRIIAPSEAEKLILNNNRQKKQIHVL